MFVGFDFLAYTLMVFFSPQVSIKTSHSYDK